MKREDIRRGDLVWTNVSGQRVRCRVDACGLVAEWPRKRRVFRALLSRVDNGARLPKRRSAQQLHACGHVRWSGISEGPDDASCNACESTRRPEFRPLSTLERALPWQAWHDAGNCLDNARERGVRCPVCADREPEPDGGGSGNGGRGVSRLSRCSTVGEMLAELPDAERAHQAASERGLLQLPVRWNSRLRTSAGRCEFVFGEPVEIELSPKLIGEGEQAVRDTFLHELAHALLPMGEAHSERWRRTLLAIGGNGRRHHRYASLARKMRLVGHCSRCREPIRTARRLSTDPAVIYRHRGCGGVLVIG